jgi:DNA-binding SARP family transcriptional activator/tetratricopeptide (TPR) repeat protein
MEFGLLGPLAVSVDGQRRHIASGGQRVVLAALLLRANQTVPVDQIIDDLWPRDPPRTARTTLQNYVMRLRRALGPAGATRIVTQPAGYLIQATPAELDVARFADLSASGLAAAGNGDWAKSAGQLSAALALWRGQPLMDVPSERLVLREAPHLEEIRWQCLEAQVEADLHLGRHAQVTSELLRLVRDEPLRENLHVLLMLALYRSGQQAAALAAYHQARQALVEAGVKPGPRIQHMHARILQSDPDLDAPSGHAPRTGRDGRDGRDGDAAAAPDSRAAAPATAPATEPAAAPAAAPADRPVRVTPAVPRQLPTAIRNFTAREGEMRTLFTRLGGEAETTAAVPIAVISGPAGVGKTALAVKWAHQAATLFPDGQLFVNLRGFHPSDQPLASAQAIREFLDALQVPAARIPPELSGQARLLRSTLAGRRILIVLDNARDEAQIRPLLPGTAGCAVLITSRNQLMGLAATEGAWLVPLPVMTGQQARELLARLLGPARVAAEEDSAAELAELTGGLPLALSIAAARAASEPHLALAGFCAAMRGTGGLDALDTGDEASSVRQLLSWSYRALTEPAARMFRLLGLHPGHDLSASAAASLAAVPVPQARRQLAELVRYHMVGQTTHGRYALHDLLRAYAVEEAAARDDQAARQAAVLRLLDHYLHTARAAGRMLDPTREPVTPPAPQPGAITENFGDYGQALGWLETERKVLLAAVSLASEGGFDVHACQLPSALATYLGRRGHWHDWIAVQGMALTAARRLADEAAQARAQLSLGRAYERFCRYSDSYACVRQALTLYEKLGDHIGQADAHLTSARLGEMQGRHAESLRHAEQSLRHFRACGQRAGQADALNTVGWQHAMLGDHVRALVHCQQALDLGREIKNQHVEAAALDSLGYAHHHLGDYGEAIACQRQALGVLNELGDRANAAQVLIHLGDTRQAAGDPAAAQDAFREALAILDDLHHPDADRVRAKISVDGRRGEAG